ncbi:MAG TPA: hypothetical protein VN377_06890 [Candidatus Thermoplasmatota archaeon]|nr:hypothetical protein [Candidatus Thermoplasmatota archaeon]
MKPRKADYVFLIAYLIILIFLLFITPVTVIEGTGSSQEINTPLLPEIAWLLLYIIGTPLLYLLLRRFIYPRKKQTNHPNL